MAKNIEYKVECEYFDRSGKHRKAYYCTVFSAKKSADNFLCEIMSNLEKEGCTEVQGNVVEL